MISKHLYSEIGCTCNVICLIRSHYKAVLFDEDVVILRCPLYEVYAVHVYLLFELMLKV